LLPHLIEDEEFIKKVKESPKLFTGFSDTTTNHLMFYNLGAVSFYGPNFLSDIAELEEEMLPYTKEAFETFFMNPSNRLIKSSPIWYLERNDFSVEALGTKRKSQNEIYFDEYNIILSDFATKHKIPTIVNINFGHAYPRNVIPYGITATIDFDGGIISLNEPVFSD
jgi:muramoyltetrapeptide carboxypeptidase LdcA involved in peptidoglycan recycling